MERVSFGRAGTRHVPEPHSPQPSGSLGSCHSVVSGLAQTHLLGQEGALERSSEEGAASSTGGAEAAGAAGGCPQGGGPQAHHCLSTGNSDPSLAPHRDTWARF